MLKVTRAADMQSGTDGLPCPIGCKQINAYAVDCDARDRER